MKRSEILELIRKDIFFCKCAEEDIDPERILLTIEKAGMLPPSKYGYEHIGECEWETEDEEK